MAGRPPAFALPTEPLLEQPTAASSRLRVSADVETWLEELSNEPDLATRSRLLCATLRKNLDQPKANEILVGILVDAAAGRARGVAALAALLAVRAPGVAVIEAVRDFANVKRMTRRYRARLDHDEPLAPSAHQLLAAAEAAGADLEPTDGAEARDVPTGAGRELVQRLRAGFGRIVTALEERGTLSDLQIDRFLRLARLEILASGQRTSELAETVNPYSTRHVSRLMPILSIADTQVREVQAFLDRLEETRRASEFAEQHPCFQEHLDGAEIRRLRERARSDASLMPIHRLVHLITRNPLPSRRLGFFVAHLLGIGETLRSRRLRRDRLNVVEAALVALEFVAEQVLVLPASKQVRDALGADKGGFEVLESGIRLPFDDEAARVLDLPYGLPVPEPENGEGEPETPEQSIKELVLANLNRSSILLGLLKNPKIVQTPGVVSAVVHRCRDLRILGYVCDTRMLHTGIANRDVPDALLRSPMHLPIKTLRKFINVRYVGKLQLRRMANDRSNIRREVANEIDAYLRSLA
jgi:hypothetical protein